MQKTKKKEKGRGGVVRGAIYGIITAVVMLSCFAICVSKKAELADKAELAVVAINIIAAFICGITAVRGKAKNRLIYALAAGALMVAAALITGLALDADNISFGGMLQITAISLVGSAVCSVLNLCKSNKKLRIKGAKRT